MESIIAESLARRPDMLSALLLRRRASRTCGHRVPEFMPKFFVSANGTYGTGGLSVTAIPSVGPELPTVNISGNQLGGSILASVTFPFMTGGHVVRSWLKLVSASRAPMLGWVRSDRMLSARSCSPPQRLADGPLSLRRLTGPSGGCTDDV